jgi:hypothetical protein
VSAAVRRFLLPLAPIGVAVPSYSGLGTLLGGIVAAVYPQLGLTPQQGAALGGVVWSGIGGALVIARKASEPTELQRLDQELLEIDLLYIQHRINNTEAQRLRDAVIQRYLNRQ